MAGNDNIKRLLQGLESEDESRVENEFQELYADAPRSFGPGFADRISERIEEETGSPGVDYFLPRVFKWFAMAGVAAAVALLVMTYVNQDSISLDAISGISDVSIAEAESLDI